MLLALILAAGLVPLISAQETIPSRGSFDGLPGVTYNCPTGQTIDTAYFGYCPATNSQGDALEGITTYIPYSQAPSYQTVAGEFELACGYPINDPDPVCSFVAGGGQPLSPDPSRTNTGCPAPSPGVPQPSGGSNYRRATEMEKRATLGTRPEFVCPFTSDNADVYLTDSQIDAGIYAVSTSNQQGFTAGASDLVFGCGIKTVSSTVLCLYTQSGASISFSGSNPVSNPDACPTTLCTAIYDGSGNAMRRRTFVEGSALKIKSRQVDPRTIREKANKKRRLDIKPEPSF